MNDFKPFIADDQIVSELTIRSIVLAVILTVILAISNAFLALKLGILTSASIPAAIISMGVLRFFKNPSILENNAVQTAASAGEAISGGIVYAIPALIIIGYWYHFDYLTNFFIAASGGILGVLFSIPLRRVLVHDTSLAFPEGIAIAEVLKSSTDKTYLRDILYGGVVGAILELLQVGFKVIASSWTYWFTAKRSLFALGLGFSPTMIGAGYLVGYPMTSSIFLGAVLSWFIALPVVSQLHPDMVMQHSINEAMSLLWNNELRYLGIGAMLCAGIVTFIRLIKPLLISIRRTSRSASNARLNQENRVRTDRDIPTLFLVIGIVFMAALLFLFFQWIFPLESIGLTGTYSSSLIFIAVLYVLIIGGLFSVMTAYFSGMVGVTASPGSSVVIAGILLAAWLLLMAINAFVPLPLSHDQMIAAEAIIIIVGSVVQGIAAIANDNAQDLKVGQLIGATPWKQQLMLLLGVMISALVIPGVMQVLFDVYGIAGVTPRPGMDMSQTLPAPTAALLAAITAALLNSNLPWTMLLSGASIILLIIVLQRLVKHRRFMQRSILGVAIGMYLPLDSSIALFLGGLMALWAHTKLQKQNKTEAEIKHGKQLGTLIACGLVAGSALLDVLLAIPFSIRHSSDALRLLPLGWDNAAFVIAIIVTGFLAKWMTKKVCN